MDFFGVVAMVWLACAAGAALVGRFFSRSGEAMTLGVLFGPVGLILTLLLVGRALDHQRAVVLPFRDARRQPRAEDGPPIE
jgi:hypothetical protein